MKSYIAGDYAGFDSKNLSVYYGYEEVDVNHEWCFVAKFNGRTVKIPAPKLAKKGLDHFECVDCLLEGIAILFDIEAIK